MTAPFFLSEFYARLTTAPPARRARRSLLVLCWFMTCCTFCTFSQGASATYWDAGATFLGVLATWKLWQRYLRLRGKKGEMGRKAAALMRWGTEWPFGISMLLLAGFLPQNLAAVHRAITASSTSLPIATGAVAYVAAVGFLSSLVWWWIQVIAELGWPVKPKTEVIFSTEGVWPPAPKRPDETTQD